MKYEIFYLIGASRETEIEKIKKEVVGIITESGGVFSEKETLEKRKLSYKINHETHGIYIAQRFELEDNQKLSDINKKLNLNSGVLRFILSRADELPELKSKEERMAEQEKRMASAEKPKEEKSASDATRPRITDKKEVFREGEAKKKVSEEDIDKKLEEILNI